MDRQYNLGSFKLRLLLLAMTTAADWGLLSPDGTLHKLCEPNFFVGRDDEMDLTLKVRLICFHLCNYAQNVVAVSCTKLKGNKSVDNVLQCKP